MFDAYLIFAPVLIEIDKPANLFIYRRMGPILVSSQQVLVDAQQQADARVEYLSKLIVAEKPESKTHWQIKTWGDERVGSITYK